MEPDQSPTVDQLARELVKLAVLLLLRVAGEHEAKYPGLWWLADQAYEDKSWRKNPSAALTTMIREAIFQLDGQFGTISKQEAALRLFNIDGCEEYPDVRQLSVRDLVGARREGQKNYDYLLGSLLARAEIRTKPDSMVANLRDLIAQNLLKLYAPQASSDTQPDLPPLRPKTAVLPPPTAVHDSSPVIAADTDVQSETHLPDQTADTPTSNGEHPEPDSLPQSPTVPAWPPSPPVPDDLRPWLTDLAAKLRHQLESEQDQDRVSFPRSIPVRWSLTEQHLSSHPDVIWGEGVQPSFSTGGTFDAITDLFGSVPSGRLVILGRGGAGKTVLVRELALKLLERQPDGPVPVIFRLSSWDLTKRGSLHDWMASQLIESHRALVTATKNNHGRRVTVAAELVNGRHILPILDGLDEVAPPHRATALERINDALRRGDHLVLTSRPAEYVAAVEAGGVVSGGAVIELHDLTLDDLAVYLPRTAPVRGQQADTSKWSPVLAQLRKPNTTGTALIEVLTTPLMASLARAIYSRATADPAELLDAGQFPSTGAITDYLLDQFVRTRYSDVPQDDHDLARPQWQPDAARRWLGFLAIMTSAQGTREFAWWKPGQRRSMRLLNWPANGLMILAGILSLGFEYAAISLPSGNPDSLYGVARLVLVISTIACVAAAFAIWLGGTVEPRELNKPSWRWMRQRYPGLTLRTSWKALPTRETILLTVVLGASVVIIEFSLDHTLFYLLSPRSSGADPSFSVVFVSLLLVSALSGLLFIGFLTPGEIDVTSPARMLREDRRAAIATGLYYGVIISAMCDTTWVYAGHLLWLVVTPVLFAFAVLIAFCLSVYGSWFIRSVGFALPGVGWLPRPRLFMSFLDDACVRGVLRQVGGVYQFRHALLQERLAVDFLDHRDSWVMKHRTILYVRTHLALARLDAGIEVDATVSELRELMERHRQLWQNTYGVVSLWDRLIHALRKTGRRDDALSEATSFQQFVNGIGTRGPRRYWHYRARRALADALADAGRFDEAVSEYTKALRLAENWWGQDDEDAADVRNVLAQLRGELTDQPS